MEQNRTRSINISLRVSPTLFREINKIVREQLVTSLANDGEYNLRPVTRTDILISAIEKTYGLRRDGESVTA